MRRAVLSAGLALAAAVLGPAGLAPAQASAPAPAPAPANSPATAQDEVSSLRERLLGSQQRIAMLEQQLADQQVRTAQIEVVRAKNARLVAIGQQLIDSYDHRYRRSAKDPLQLGRVRFERELQGLGDQVYANRADVPPQAEAGTSEQSSGNQ